MMFMEPCRLSTVLKTSAPMLANFAAKTSAKEKGEMDARVAARRQCGPYRALLLE